MSPQYQDCYDPSVDASETTLVCKRTVYPLWQLFTYELGSSDPFVQLTSGGSNNDAYLQPQFVHSAWQRDPSSTESALALTDIAVSSPNVSDAFLTRGITFTGPSSGVARYEYGWNSNLSASAPNTLIQSSSASPGRLSFRATTPDTDWRLFARAVGTNGNFGPWYSETVHTPKQPIWVGVGDSVSSGHHQGSDERRCPDWNDYQSGTFGTIDEQAYINICVGTGQPSDYTPNDENWSWVTRAADEFNRQANAPSAWELQVDVLAESGKQTLHFGNPAFTPGTGSWAATGTQAGMMKSYLVARSDSWNFVSMTGGANDAQFYGALAQFYRDNLNLLEPSAPTPWEVSTWTECPDTDWIWGNLMGQNGVASQIEDNLQGIVDVAVNESPGVRVIDVGYPYAVDDSDTCASDHSQGAWKGATSVVDALNDVHEALTGDNVHYLDLTSGFGTSPIGGSVQYIQTTRLYGYPHPSNAGQDRIALLAASAANSLSW